MTWLVVFCLFALASWLIASAAVNNYRNQLLTQMAVNTTLVKSLKDFDTFGTSNSKNVILIPRQYAQAVTQEIAELKKKVGEEAVNNGKI